MTPNTEPKHRPATDEEITLIGPVFGSQSNTDGLVKMLILRLEQEREMRREFQALLTVLKMDRGFRLYVHDTYQDQAEALLARAAKMEEDHAK